MGFPNFVQDIVSGNIQHLHIGKYNVEQRQVIDKAVHIAAVVADFYLKSVSREKFFQQVSQRYIVFENEYIVVNVAFNRNILRVFVRRFFYGL